MIPVDSLGIQISAEASRASQTLENLVRKLDRMNASLSRAGGSSMAQMSTNVSRLANAGNSKSLNTLARSFKKISEAANSFPNLSNVTSGLTSINNINFNADKIKNFINALTRLSSSNISSVDFANLGNSINRMVVSLSNAPKIQSSTVAITKALGTLGRYATNLPAVSANLQSLGTALRSALTVISGSNPISDNIIQFTNALSKLASAGDKTAATASHLNALSVGLKNVITVLSTAPNVSSNTLLLAQAIGNIASSGNNAGKAATSLSKSLKNYSSSTQKATSGSFSLAAAIGKIYATYWMLFRVIKLFGKIFTKSMDFIETSNYFEKAFGQIASNADLSSWKELGYASAEEYAESFSERARELTSKMTGFDVGKGGNLTPTGGVNLGIDPDLLMQYQATFGQMASSIGLSSENSLRLSNALTMIGADLASVRNMNFEDVWTNLTSGLAGAARAVDKYGANIRDAGLQQKLTELGINASIKSLGQQEKAILRTIVILNSSKYAWGDLAETINQPANQLRLLKSNFLSLGRTIGNLFLPIVSKLLPVINAITIALQRLFMAMAKVLGIEVSEFSTSVGGMADIDMGDLAEDVEDTSSGLGNAAANAKKLKDYLLGIDELNVIKEDTGDTGGGAGGGGGSVGGLGGQLDQALIDAISEYEKRWTQAFEGVENKAQRLADVLTGIANFRFDNLASGFEFSFEFNSFDTLKQNLQGLSDLTKRLFEDEDVFKSVKDVLIGIDEAAGAFYGTITSLSLSIATGFSGGALKSFTDSFGFIKDTIESISKSIQNVLKKFQGLAKAVSTVGTAFESEGFQEIIAFMSQLSIYATGSVFDNVTGYISDLFSSFASPYIDNAEEWKEVLEGLFGIVSELTEPLRTFLTVLMGNDKSYQDSPMHGFLSEISKFKADGIGIVLSAISENLSNVLSVIQKVKNNISQFKSWIGTNFTEPIKGLFTILTENIFGDFSALTEDMKILWSPISDWFDENVISKIDTSFSNLKTDIKHHFEGAWIIVQSIWSVVPSWFKATVLGGILANFSEIPTSIPQFFKLAEQSVKKIWENLPQWFKTTIVGNTLVAFSSLGTDISSVFSGLLEGIKLIWAGLPDWFKTTIIGATITTFSNFGSDLASAFKGAFSVVTGSAVSVINSLIGKIENAINKIIDGVNMFRTGFNTLVTSGAEILGKDWKPLDRLNHVNFGRINGYEHGGFPEPASLFYAGEHGIPELLGTVGGRTAVAGGAEITGIREAVYSTGQAEVSLLSTAVALLREIAEKDMNVNIGDREIAKASNRGNAMLGRQLITV